MVSQPGAPPAVRPLAAHVQRALARATQAKTAPSPAGAPRGRALAPHVQAAVGRSHHVQAAIARTAQARLGSLLQQRPTPFRTKSSGAIQLSATSAAETKQEVKASTPTTTGATTGTTTTGKFREIRLTSADYVLEERASSSAYRVTAKLKADGLALGYAAFTLEEAKENASSMDNIGLLVQAGITGTVAHLTAWYNSTLTADGPADIYRGFAPDLLRRCESKAKALGALYMYLEPSSTAVRKDPNTNTKEMQDPSDVYLHFGYSSTMIVEARRKEAEKQLADLKKKVTFSSSEEHRFLESSSKSPILIKQLAAPAKSPATTGKCIVM